MAKVVVLSQGSIEIMNDKVAIIVLVTGIVSACSSSQKNPEFEDYLATNIHSGGSKEFYYTVTLSNAGGSKRGGNRNVSAGAQVSGGSSGRTSGSGGITVGGSGGGHQGGRGSHAAAAATRQDEKMSEQLEKKLQASGYCRDGWKEKERHIQHPYASIRGECNETATDRDRENFPNSEDASV